MSKKTFNILNEVKVNKKIVDKSAIKKKIDPYIFNELIKYE